ncbi:penicillin-binding transpeptidase domain-containing protein [Cryptosporangium arvum]|uniref:Cell division protein FtsI/penicillin-binding protein 2 n=1 Tax=Cryptosporangium arvum DSM 44712 TaxID=927661 RepID=A0A010YLR4_9ACTN|nr:penicillin-binding transpeptidase domain-containing protein [Cryptosporangium arvum]EXG81165.1 cell division protein FtsI/penicillin-binding protein 2 [Cryptosporangium arvum DSM 44712]
MNVLKGRAVLAALGVLAAVALTACSADNDPEPAVDAFLKNWRQGQLGKTSFVDPDGKSVPAADVTAQLTKLTGELAAAPTKLERAGDAKVKDGRAVSPVQVTWTLPGPVTWTYRTDVRLRERDDTWDVTWEPALVHKKLKAGDTLGTKREEAPRSGILDHTGAPIVSPRPVVSVLLDPAKVTDPAAAVKQLGAAFATIDTEVDLADLPGRLAKAKPGIAVDVVVLRQEAYDKIASRITAITGATVVKSTRDLAPTRQFARALLGSVSDATEEDIKEKPGLYAVGDHVGHGGLQSAFDQRLRGVPGVTVVVNPAGTALFTSAPKPGVAVRTTLDQRVQTAADAALADLPQQSALVAIRISDGSVIAAANGPDGGSFNAAFEAKVPPGSTFKMVSTLGLLDQGAVTADATVACPSHLAAGGREFKNFDDFELGDVPFRTDFAKSCNTAFVALAPKLGPDGLADAGRLLGLESKYGLGLPAFSGKVSTGGDAAERAAAAFGQGRTVVSPLAMASATAAVASGRWTPPSLTGKSAVAPGPQLKTTTVEPLRAMMRQVVTDGTATSLRDVPGSPVYGKTGTAEFDNDPEHAHAWWVGWQGDVAFAVFVENGGHSSSVSVPVAEKFLRGLK